MHKKENMGLVELATVSFGQSFQVTPVQLAATVSSLINGGRRVTPHFGIQVRDRDGALLKVLEYPLGERILSEETSETVRGILKEVVSAGSGKNAAIEGYSIGGKTATSETIPRSAHRVHFVFFRLYSGGKSHGSGNLCDPQSPGRLLWRHRGRPGDPGYFCKYYPLSWSGTNGNGRYGNRGGVRKPCVMEKKELYCNYSELSRIGL